MTESLDHLNVIGSFIDGSKINFFSSVGFSGKINIILSCERLDLEKI